ADDHASHDCTSFWLKRYPVADPELEHSTVRARLAEEPQALDDPIVQVDEFRFGERVDVDPHVRDPLCQVVSARRLSSEADSSRRAPAMIGLLDRQVLLEIGHASHDLVERKAFRHAASPQPRVDGAEDEVVGLMDRVALGMELVSNERLELV